MLLNKVLHLHKFGAKNITDHFIVNFQKCRIADNHFLIFIFQSIKFFLFQILQIHAVVGNKLTSDLAGPCHDAGFQLIYQTVKFAIRLWKVIRIPEFVLDKRPLCHTFHVAHAGLSDLTFCILSGACTLQDFDLHRLSAIRSRLCTDAGQINIQRSSAIVNKKNMSGKWFALENHIIICKKSTCTGWFADNLYTFRSHIWQLLANVPQRSSS